jgi:hypothetical protein
VRVILVETASRFARDILVQETGHRYLKELGVELIAVDSPAAFLDDSPTAKMVRQLLGVISEFEKAATVAQLAGAPRKLRTRTEKRLCRLDRARMAYLEAREAEPCGLLSSRSKQRQDALADAIEGWRGPPGLDDGTGHSGACVLICGGRAYEALSPLVIVSFLLTRLADNWLTRRANDWLQPGSNLAGTLSSASSLTARKVC